MTYKAVLFDLDGTLADTAHCLLACFNRCRDDYDLPQLSLEDVRHAVPHGTPALVELAFQVKPGDKDYEHFSTLLHDEYAKYAATETVLFPGINAILEKLHQSNIPFGVVTDKIERFTHPIIANLDLSKKLKSLVCGDTIPERKPKPDPLLHACRELDLPPEQVIYVGDSYKDQLAAAAANMPLIYVSFGYGDLVEHECDAPLWHCDSVKQLDDMLLQKLAR